MLLLVPCEFGVLLLLGGMAFAGLQVRRHGEKKWSSRLLGQLSAVPIGAYLLDGFMVSCDYEFMAS